MAPGLQHLPPSRCSRLISCTAVTRPDTALANDKFESNRNNSTCHLQAAATSYPALLSPDPIGVWLGQGFGSQQGQQHCHGGHTTFTLQPPHAPLHCCRQTATKLGNYSARRACGCRHLSRPTSPATTWARGWRARRAGCRPARAASSCCLQSRSGTAAGRCCGRCMSVSQKGHS